MADDVLTSGNQSRAAWLDAVRGVAVIAMVFYHFCWDLSHFGLIATDVAFDPGWRFFAQSIAASFLGISGISLALANMSGFAQKVYFRRVGIVAGAALLVTIGSWFAFPDRYIFFGILHCIAASSLIAAVFLRAPLWLTGLAAMISFALPQLFSSEAFNHHALIWLGLGLRLPATNDFVPLFPWLGFVLLGLAVARIAIMRELFSFGGPQTWLSHLGQWSLPIYLVHQPVLFAAFLGASQIGLFGSATETNGFVSSCTAECRIAGVDHVLCARSCSCTADALRQLPIWPHVQRGSLDGAQQTIVAQTGQQCFEDAVKNTEMSRKP